MNEVYISLDDETYHENLEIALDAFLEDATEEDIEELRQMKTLGTAEMLYADYCNELFDVFERKDWMPRNPDWTWEESFKRSSLNFFKALPIPFNGRYGERDISTEESKLISRALDAL